MYSPRYLDASAPIPDRVQDLLGRLTLEEKAGQLSQFFYFGGLGALPDDFDIESLPAEHQFYARQPKQVEAAIANGLAGSVLFVKDAELANRLQRLALEDSHHGIPLLFGFDVIHGLRTVFPVPIAQAASWDPSVAESAQAAAAREARASGIHWTFAPMIDIARDPRWGRIVESPGEDPYLAAAFAAAQVRGFQGDFGPERILAGAKHLAGYGAARGGRDYDEVDLSDSELRNVYLPPFMAAIDAGSATVMSAYMELNGTPASGNRWLLTDILRDELHFEGFVVSDANAVKSLEAQHFAASSTDAAARAVSAGLDMEMAMIDPAFGALPQAVAEGLVDEVTIDRAVARVLTAKFTLGLFENPYADEASSQRVLNDPRHRELARGVAEKSVVLLKNDAILPLATASLSSLAVIGQLADSKRDLLGSWVFAHDTDETVTILDGIRNRAGNDVSVNFAAGAAIPPRVFPNPFDAQDLSVVETPPGYDDDAEIAIAVETAARADIAVVVVGERQNQSGESSSKSTLELPGRQLEQLTRIVATGTPVVLLVESGRPLDLRWADEHVAAIMQVWYPGTRGGEAIAGHLFGDTSPAGRLPFSWPRHVGHVPLVYSHLRTFAPQDQDKRYWDEESTPLYPFGHGLSYAAFDYTDLRVLEDRLGVGESTQVSVTITNTTPTPADEVVQLYIHQRHGLSSRPVRELKGFERIAMDAHETRTVVFELGPQQLRYWSAVTRSWVQESSTIDIWVGGSSLAHLTTTLTVVPAPPM
ncbi:glycoside hydrolase family 3 N-terminal domain-containing protein [Herbiconiux sp. 11R-BC]|uniref:glycoside hydrolase family 3 N-terminal domain-containing protein n=1 Tax=Herbiconiux sp. 11R-BC TaxID=3111637 RepID=UPI003C0A7EF4